MLSELEIFADARDNKLEAITELEIEDHMQPNLFDEVVVITSNDGNQDLLSLIKPSKGPLTNWYTEEERAAEKTLPEPSLESRPDAKSCLDLMPSPVLSLNLTLSLKSSQNPVPSLLEQIIECLKKFADCFMWKASDITGIDPAITVHKILVYPEAKPVKQKLRRLKTELSLKIKEEVAKQLENKFMEPIAYPTWLANIVPVPKKDGKVRMCVDYRDLNKACPKDDFPLPHIDLLVDRMAGHDGPNGWTKRWLA
ncbi:uncharacterized protein LOC119369460 [Jatropha curcas]|uniref:uncharacterized protein LOC119369460 n=1 Tax=Jatropha curcas TaxID=180498 RepID=UPI001893FFB4|nr:uncharacterized protein LOC119369460 [Jatropha curcas]